MKLGGWEVEECMGCLERVGSTICSGCDLNIYKLKIQKNKFKIRKHILTWIQKFQINVKKTNYLNIDLNTDCITA